MGWSSEHWQEDMSNLRSKIDRLDQKILRLIIQRMEVCRNVGKIKLRVGRPIFDPDREREVIEDRINFSRALGRDGEFVRKIMSLMMDYSKRIQVIDMRKLNGGLSSANIANPAQ